MLFAQQRPPNVSVPFVGCRSDGQVGPREVPVGASKLVALSPNVAAKLAWYSAFDGTGALGPRSWYCFGTYGSGGDTLFISPTPLNPNQFFGNARETFAGASIQFSRVDGETSGRFQVAQFMAIAFPEWKKWVDNVRNELDEPESGYHWGPYPKDRLTYKSKTAVEYATPAHSPGLGTRSWLEPGERPIQGVAILVGDTPDLWHVSIRLPANLDSLAAPIIQQVERDAAKLGSPSAKK